MNKTPALIACLAALVCISVHARADYPKFAAWARERVEPVRIAGVASEADLETLRRMIGDADVVSFGEGLHGSVEPLEFRNLLFRLLVEEMGFTAIALESGITESFPLDDYVLGGPGDPGALAKQGITSGLGAFPQQAELLRWMHEFNLGVGDARKIHFYGMDISGFPGEPGAPLDTALAYLDHVDPKLSDSVRRRLGPSLPKLKIDRFSRLPDHYGQLTQEQRDQGTATVADLIVEFETNEAAYIAASSERKYESAYRAAIAARQVDDYLRRIPVGWSAKDGVLATVGTIAVADRAKMDNIQWIRDQQPGRGKILLFAHLGHVATTDVSVQLPGEAPLQLPPLVGPYLHRRYHEKLVTIGHFYSRDLTPCDEAREAAEPGSLEGTLAEFGLPAFVLDLRGAPLPVAAELAPALNLFGQRPVHSLSVGEGVDLILYTETASRALPCK